MKPTHALLATLLASIAGAQASAPDAVVSAIGKARRDNQRVLLVCGDDGVRARLSGPLSRLVMYEYALVELAESDPYALRFAPESDTGSYLVILDNQYGHVATKPVSELADASATEAFLTSHQAVHLDANSLYEKALSVAEQTNRRVFLHTGAPWCGWCRKLEEFLGQPQVHVAFSQDFVDLKIDVERMIHGQELSERLRKGRGGGIPWIVILDADGAELISSTNEEGENIGSPAAQSEVDHFVKMIRETSQHLSDQDLDAFEIDLNIHAARIRTPPR